MKRKFLIATVCLFFLSFGLSSCANSSAKEKEKNASISQLIDEYRRQDGFLTLNIPPSLIQMIIKGEDAKELRNVVNEIEDLEILICSDEDGDNQRFGNFRKDLDKVLDQKKYEDLFVINDSGEEVSVKMLEKKGKVEELILLIKGKGNGAVLLNITGAIDKKTARKLSKSINVNGNIDIDLD